MNHKQHLFQCLILWDLKQDMTLSCHHTENSIQSYGITDLSTKRKMPDYLAGFCKPELQAKL